MVSDSSTPPKVGGQRKRPVASLSSVKIRKLRSSSSSAGRKSSLANKSQQELHVLNDISEMEEIEAVEEMEMEASSKQGRVSKLILTFEDGSPHVDGREPKPPHAAVQKSANTHPTPHSPNQHLPKHTPLSTPSPKWKITAQPNSKNPSPPYYLQSQKPILQTLKTKKSPPSLRLLHQQIKTHPHILIILPLRKAKQILREMSFRKLQNPIWSLLAVDQLQRMITMSTPSCQ